MLGELRLGRGRQVEASVSATVSSGTPEPSAAQLRLCPPFVRDLPDGLLERSPTACLSTPRNRMARSSRAPTGPGLGESTSGNPAYRRSHDLPEIRRARLHMPLGPAPSHPRPCSPSPRSRGPAIKRSGPRPFVRNRRRSRSRCQAVSSTTVLKNVRAHTAGSDVHLFAPSGSTLPTAVAHRMIAGSERPTTIEISPLKCHPNDAWLYPMTPRMMPMDSATSTSLRKTRSASRGATSPTASARVIVVVT